MTMAQPVANFSASSTSGCSPLTNVQFTDLSTGSPTSWVWKRNGTQFSTLQNPTATFSSSGVYVISLTATNSSGSSSSSLTITVYNNPTSAFSATSAASGCLPHTVTFQDNSTISGGTITSWLWSFGDGGQSALKNPNHTYTLSGNFPVSLKVIDNHGCEDTKQIPNYVQTYPLPYVSFSSSSVRQTCAPPITVNFSNSSAGTGTLTYLWKFGDGTTSTLATPSHTYTTMGSFDVTLVVTDNNSCTDSTTFSSFVKVQSINADFTRSNDSICLGDSIVLLNSSTGALFYSWDFGDSKTTTGYKVSHLYQDSGWYEIRMIASIPAIGCSDTVYKNVYVQRVIADFDVVPNYVCQLPQEVVYINNSTNWSVKEWYRSFNCPNNSPYYTNCGVADTSDTIIYSTNPVFRNVEQIYRDTLVVTSDLGCRDTMVKDSSLIISLVRAGPQLSKAGGCRPFNINFLGHGVAYNSSVFVPSPTPTLTSFEWLIEDTLFSNLKNPTLNVTDTGVWKGWYKIENSLGCRDSAEIKFRAGDSVIADFYMLHDTICAGERDTAISLSQDSTYINYYSWFTFPATSIAFGKEAQFAPEYIGPYAVGHIVSHNGCSDTLLKYGAFYAKGPIVDFASNLFNCTDSTTIEFKSLMQQAYRWYWNFGDTTIPIDSTSINPTITYQKKGNYYVTLQAFSADSACEYTAGHAIAAYNLQSVITNLKSTYSPDHRDYNYEDTIRICAPNRIYFTAYSSPNAKVANWNINGRVINGINPDSILSHTFKQRGYYTVTLVVQDTVANCWDTSIAIVAVYKPVADIIGNPHKGCTPLSVFLEDSVLTYNKIVAYEWLVDTIMRTSKTFSYVFNSNVNYAARLIVTDSFGCADTVIKANYITTSNFNMDFYGTNIRLLCAGDSLQFLQVIPNPDVDFTWIYGNNDTAKGNNPYLLFPDSGNFDVVLIGRDSSGCKKSLLKGNYVKVQAYPNANFTGIPRDSTCYPLPVQFYADSSMPYFLDNTYYYDLGDFGAASNYQDPFYNYVRPGSYTISLIATTTYGCSDTIVKSNYINISGPYGELGIEPDSICRGDSVRFDLLNPINATNFGWDFGDGASVMNQSSVYHLYSDSIGYLYPTLFFTDSIGGCPKTFTDTLYIFKTYADFSIIDTIGCVPFDPELRNLSKQSNSYQWDFGDGITSTVKDPGKVYNLPGSYRIQLSVKGNGCKDTIYKEIDVFPIPEAFAEGDTLLCEGDSVQLFSSGGEVYIWSPAQGLSDAQIHNPISSPKYSTYYEVLVTDTNGCEDIDSVIVLVQNSITVALNDLVLVVGDTITLSKAYGGPGVTYKWTPPEGLSCDTCAAPLLTALESRSYSVVISDTNGCFETATTFVLEVEDKYTVDVPQAFTPNGDGINDVVYVRGWGIKELISFKIYNRWGELIFESNDLSVGWDGSYKGKIQGIETYVYYVEVLTYGDEVLKAKGNINLLK